MIAPLWVGLEVSYAVCRGNSEGKPEGIPWQILARLQHQTQEAWLQAGLEHGAWGMGNGGVTPNLNRFQGASGLG